MAKELENFRAEREVYDFIYGKLDLEDFVPIIRDNVLNINVEDYVFYDLTFENVIDILDDELIRNINSPNENFLSAACAAGKITIMASLMYNFGNFFGLDNIYEMYLLAKNALNKALTEDEKIITKFNGKKIAFFLKEALFVEFSEYKLLTVDHNNSNRTYNQMLQGKIEREVKPGAIVVKIFDNFEASQSLRFKKAKTLKNKYNKNFMVFYYEKK
ncbi:MAG: hypothetical protein LBB09_02555 [Rickettsiales bacterium]|jgi:hypothetical protein|nr:hypothetical protein [Rickettsiales bacterium]